MTTTEHEGTPTGKVVPRVLVFFDYACPFCYLDWPRFKRLRAEHSAELVLVPYELRPTMPAQGVPLEQLGPRHSERVETYMRKMAEEGRLSLVFPDFMPNTHSALALGEFARDVGPDAHEAIHEALFEAYNGRAADIGNETVLLDVAESHGFDRGEVAEAFVQGTYDERLHQFYHLALSMGVTATPAALICNELLIGTRPYKLLEDSLQRCLIDEHNISVHVASAVEPELSSTAEGAPATIDR